MKIPAALALAGLFVSSAGSATAFPITFTTGDYDNKPNTVPTPPPGSGSTPVNNQTTGLFRDVFWWSINNDAPRVASPDFINQGNSLVTVGNHASPGSGPYTALNFTGPAINGGQSYLAIYDETPADGIVTRNVFDASQPNGIQVSADVLFAPGQHIASGGVVALYNQGQDALALLASNGGGNNQDTPELSLVFRSVGQGITLTSVPLNGLTTFSEGAWYRVTMDLSVVGGTFTVNASFQNHSTPGNPTSGPGSLITSFMFAGSLSDPDLLAATHNSLVLTNPGEIGVMAMGNNIAGNGCPPPFNSGCTDSVGISITNFNEASLTPVPEPGTMFLAGTGLIVLGYTARRRLFGR